MKYCVMCVYWMLLLISVVSSGLLFLIVASENIQEKHPVTSDETENLGSYNNISSDENENGITEPSDVVMSQVQNAVIPKANYKSEYVKNEPATVSASFETFNSDELRKDKNLEILAESLTQQPNLSQGISETGQAVVLTLVDTATAELQSLAEPKINSDQFRSKAAGKNTSVSASNVSRYQEKRQEGVPTTQIPAPPILDETTTRPNDTKDSGDENQPVVQTTIVEEVPEVVVVVRAEQKFSTDGVESQTEEEVVQVVPEDIARVDDAFTTAPELNDSAARAQLVGGTRDEATVVILDGIVASGPTDPHEDIPSFSEWAQKRLEEAEKKKTHPNVSVQNPGGPGRSVGGMKVRSKNYASPDCGAKVVAVNPEARSAKSVLVSTRDEYMLNTCTSRIWFVVELCEAIQAKKIELANFELFSSSPKDFSVYVSDRFPTRDWSPVGQFMAKDEKDVQSFTLHPHLFGKFIKVELQSHHGSEHFCPISLFRAYGTSEFEVLETETENQVTRETNSNADDDEDSDEEEPIEVENGEPPRNLFGSARDAVLSIVKKAAEVLVKSSELSGNNITKIQQSIDSGSILDNSYSSCTTPRYTILCGNCSDQKFAKVFQIVSCRNRQLEDLLRIETINRTLRYSGLCGRNGVDIKYTWDDYNYYYDDELGTGKKRREGISKVQATVNLQASFFASLFKPEYIVALCNVLATKERKVVMNTSHEISANSLENITSKEDVSTKTDDQSADAATGTHQQSSNTCISESGTGCKSTSSREQRKKSQESSGEEVVTPRETPDETLSTGDGLVIQIKPTKTLSKDDPKKEPTIPTREPSKELKDESFQVEVITTITPSSNLPTPTIKVAEDQSIVGASVETTPRTATSAPSIGSDGQEAIDNIALDPEYLDAGIQSKNDKLEPVEQNGKQGKLDLGEQEVKIQSQDQLTFDTLLSDLKDLESDAASLQNGPANSAASTQPTASSTPQQKESVFLRLSNRIKALERNMSLSGQYLEELSRRYKKQVEEMQRSLERAVSAMSEESRKGEERDTKRLEEIAALREEIAILSKSMESLLYDRDSWRNRISAIGQHALLICLEVVIVILILSYCRRAADYEDEEEEHSVTRKEAVARRKSTENFTGHPAGRKTKRRRPSEIASHISASYHELMIEDRCQETKKEKKKKRRRDTVAASPKITVSSEPKIVRYKSALNISAGTNLPSRRSSSIDVPKSNDLQCQSPGKPDSAPEVTAGWFHDQIQRIEKVQSSTEGRELDLTSEPSSDVNRLADDPNESISSCATVDRSGGSPTAERMLETSKNGLTRSGGILKGARLSSPSFMKTALVSRKKRKVSAGREQVNFEAQSGLSSDRSHPDSPTSLKASSETVSGANGGTTNGLIDESDESRSSSTTPTSGKKEKKSTGLKKMVRKLF